MISILYVFTTLLFCQATPASTQATSKSEVSLEKVDFRELPLSEACRLLSEQTELNLVPSAEAGQMKVSLFLRDIPAMTAVESLCKSHQLWFQRDPKTEVIRIYTVKEYKNHLNSIHEEQTEVFTLLYPNAVDVAYALRDSFGDRVSLRMSGMIDWGMTQELQERLRRFDILDTRTQGFSSRDQNSNRFNNGYNNNYNNNNGNYGGYGYGGSGGLYGNNGYGIGGYGMGGYGNFGNNGYMSQNSQPKEKKEMSAEEIQKIENQLAESDSDYLRSEAMKKLSSTTQTDISVTVVSRHNKLIVRSADERALEEIRTLVQRLDIPTPLLLLEMKILSVDLTDGFTSFFEYQGHRERIAGAFTTGDIVNPTPPSLALGGSGVRSGDLVFQWVNDKFAARMQLLEEKNRVTQVAAPLLLTANNEVSRLFVGKEVPLNRSFSASETLVNQATTTTTPGSTTIEFRPVGTTLMITPSINSDRTVTLRIVQETSNVDSTATVLVPSEQGFAPQELNVVSSQSVSGTIVAKNNLAIVFGGLIEKNVTRQREQVPVLGDIPFLGLLFRREVDRDVRKELIIVIRPYVLNTPAESESISQNLLNEMGVDLKSFDLNTPTKPEDKPGAEIRFRFHGVGEKAQ